MHSAYYSEWREQASLINPNWHVPTLKTDKFYSNSQRLGEFEASKLFLTDLVSQAKNNLLKSE